MGLGSAMLLLSRRELLELAGGALGTLAWPGLLGACAGDEAGGGPADVDNVNIDTADAGNFGDADADATAGPAPFLSAAAEDAPQAVNRVGLDPQVRDCNGLPVARITYRNHAFELGARQFYSPKLLDVLRQAGAQFGFVAPADTPSSSRHILGTLRMGTDAARSVCDPGGRFHEVENLYCADGAVFPTSSGYNPTLTIQAMALRTAANLVFPGSPERGLEGL